MRIQSKDSNGNYSAATGYVQLNENTELVVVGDFYTETTNSAYFGNSDSDVNISTFVLYGSFTQIGSNTFFAHQDNNCFKVVFNGNDEDEQRISFDRYDANSTFGGIEVTNATETIYLDTPLYLLRPLSSFNIIGDVEVYSIVGKDRYIYIEGSFFPKATIEINIDIDVSEDVIIDSGVTLNSAMGVFGNLHIQKLNNGVFESTTGYLTLKPKSSLIISGDFYTQSTNSAYFSIGTELAPTTVELYGDFYHIGTNTYFRHLDEKGFDFAFLGSEVQNISFGNTTLTSLGMISMWNDEGIHFNTSVNSFIANFDLLIHSEHPIGNVDLNGYVVTLTSNAVLTSVNLAGGVLVCKQDLTINGATNFSNGLIFAEKNVTLNQGGNLLMVNDCDTLIINGSFFVNTADDIYLSKGYLDLFSNLKLSEAMTFETADDFNFQFSGTQPQGVIFNPNGTVLFGTVSALDGDLSHIVVWDGESIVDVDEIYTNQGVFLSLDELFANVIGDNFDFEVSEIETPPFSLIMPAGVVIVTLPPETTRLVTTKFETAPMDIKCYIFRIEQLNGPQNPNFLAWAKSDRTKLAKKYKVKEEAIPIIKIESSGHFISEWNNMSGNSKGVIEVVVILMHGSPKTIGTQDDTIKFSIEEMGHIEPKKINHLIFLTCNTGHLDYYPHSLTWAFSNKISGCVLASDGTVKRSNLGGEVYESTNSTNFKELRNESGNTECRRDKCGKKVCV